MCYFVSICNFLSHLVLFCLIKSYFPLICVIYGMSFSWTLIFLVGQSLTKSIKVRQNCRYPPNQFHQGPTLQGWPQGGTIWLKLSYFVSIGHMLPHLVLFRYHLNQLRQGASLHAWSQGGDWGWGGGGGGGRIYLKLSYFVSIGHILSHFSWTQSAVEWRGRGWLADIFLLTLYVCFHALLPCQICRKLFHLLYKIIWFMLPGDWIIILLPALLGYWWFDMI